MRLGIGTCKEKRENVYTERFESRNKLIGYNLEQLVMLELLLEDG